MFRGLLFCSILAAQCIAVSATRRDAASLRQNLNSGFGNGLSVAVPRADDPYPCPECELTDPGRGLRSQLLNSVRFNADDPYPCPECGAGEPAGGGGPDQRT